MRYIDINGNEGTMNVGDRVKGIAFAFVMVSYDDISNPLFLPWFIENVHCRFVNKAVSH